MAVTKRPRRTVGRQAVSIRFPRHVLDAARRTKPKDESFNDFVVNAVQREADLRRGKEALARIDAIGDAIFRERGLLPDSVPLIRELREERARRLDR